MEKELINRVANSGLITINLEEFYPREEILSIDLKDYLFRGLILREKDFREAMSVHDWTQYEGKNLAVFCSADAIIPTWAYQLVAVYAAPFAKMIASKSCSIISPHTSRPHHPHLPSQTSASRTSSVRATWPNTAARSLAARCWLPVLL